MIASSTYVELTLRRSDICAGCGNVKGENVVICWKCWRDPKHGLRDYSGNLGDWLLMMDTEQRRAL